MDEDILAKKMAAVTDMSMCDIPCRMTAPNLEVKKMEQARKARLLYLILSELRTKRGGGIGK